MLQLLKKFIHTNGYQNQKETFEELFLSHPNYPSLYAITDTFNLLSIENVAVKVQKEQIEALPNQFLAIYENKLVVVNKNNKTIILENEELEKKKVKYTQFLESWNGIIIAIEPNTKAITSSKNKSPKWLLYTLPFVTLLSISIYENKLSSIDWYFLITSLIGIAVSIFILQEKFGIKNEITSKFCNLNVNTSCNSVIKSNTNNKNKYLNFTDLPLLYFSISFLALIIEPSASTNAIGFIGLGSLPIIIYSIWLQKFELKKWCVLCLAVSLILLLQSTSFVLTHYAFDFELPTRLSTILYVSIVMVGIWTFIKPIIETKYKLENSNVKLNKFKRNYALFQFLSKEIREVEDFKTLKGVTFGTENATVKLTLILSPSCGHCHTAFKEAYELFQTYTEKIYLNILFNVNPENKDNPYKTVVETLLALQEQNPQAAQKAILDWHINQLELENWKRKWTAEHKAIFVNEQIQNQYYWCLNNDFNYTPVKIINERQFPEAYEINELKYFLNDFQEEFETVKII